jgi:hypothetical protein
LSVKRAVVIVSFPVYPIGIVVVACLSFIPSFSGSVFKIAVMTFSNFMEKIKEAVLCCGRREKKHCLEIVS